MRARARIGKDGVFFLVIKDHTSSGATRPDRLATRVALGK